METVYIETSVVSYLVARPPANTLAHQWHVWTKDWWRLRRPGFECVISAEVSREAAAGDPKASRQRLEVLSTLTELRRTPGRGQIDGGVFVSRSLAGTGQGGCSAFGRGHNLAGGLSSNVEFETSGQCGDIVEVATGGRAARTANAACLHAVAIDGNVGI